MIWRAWRPLLLLSPTPNAILIIKKSTKKEDYHVSPQNQQQHHHPKHPKMVPAPNPSRNRIPHTPPLLCKHGHHPHIPDRLLPHPLTPGTVHRLPDPHSPLFYRTKTKRYRPKEKLTFLHKLLFTKTSRSPQLLSSSVAQAVPPERLPRSPLPQFPPAEYPETP